MSQSDLSRTLLPSRHQPPLPIESVIRAEQPNVEAASLDVLFVGGGPAGLAGAIELARLARCSAEDGGSLGALQIGVLEKSGRLGEHCLSGAVVNPRALRELFPELPESELPTRGPVQREAVYVLSEKRAFPIPTPPPMRNHGNRVASLCEIVRWLGEKAEELGVDVFPGFPVGALLVEGGRVVGVRTVASGRDREGRGGEPALDLTAKVTVLSEGTRGLLTQGWLEWQGIGAANPQIYALGVKELWEVERPLDRVVHTLGWPLPGDAFGGSFMYPMGERLVALGLVVGLDYGNARLDVHQLLQRLKLHPLFRAQLEGGELVEWGAKTIPEGGYYSVPERRHGDGCLVVGDAAGFVDVPSLKGIHYAMKSGIEAARVIFRALEADDTTSDGLAPYSRAIDGSYVMADLRRTRNMRLAFKRGFLGGGVRAVLMTLTGGAFPGGRMAVREDAAEPRSLGPEMEVAPDGLLTFSKVEAVFKSGNQTRDDIPPHLIVGADVPEEAAEFYAHLCPAGVYERAGDRLVVNAPNCIDCKATDVLGPRWMPREGGSGPRYQRM